MWPATLPMMLRLIAAFDAVEQRVPSTTSSAPKKMMPADDEGLEAAREQVAEGDLTTRPCSVSSHSVTQARPAPR